MRGGYARAPSGGDLLAIKRRWQLHQARVRRKVPGLFVARTPGFPVDASQCVAPNAPLAESAYARVSETRCSGFESRVGYQILCEGEISRCSFTTWMWQSMPRRALGVRTSTCGPRGGAAGVRPSYAGIAQWKEHDVASVGMRVRASLPVPTFPSSNGQNRGPSSRVCRFKSGRECQRGCSSVDRAIALQAKDAGLSPAVSTNSILAVA